MEIRYSDLTPVQELNSSIKSLSLVVNIRHNEDIYMEHFEGSKLEAFLDKDEYTKYLYDEPLYLFSMIEVQ